MQELPAPASLPVALVPVSSRYQYPLSLSTLAVGTLLVSYPYDSGPLKIYHRADTKCTIGWIEGYTDSDSVSISSHPLPDSGLSDTLYRADSLVVSLSCRPDSKALSIIMSGKIVGR